MKPFAQFVIDQINEHGQGYGNLFFMGPDVFYNYDRKLSQLGYKLEKASKDEWNVYIGLFGSVSLTRADSYPIKLTRKEKAFFRDLEKQRMMEIKYRRKIAEEDAKAAAIAAQTWP